MENVHPKEFEQIINKARSLNKPLRVAVAGGDSENILKGLFEAVDDGFIDPILIGNYEKTMELLETLGFKDKKYDIQPITDETNPVQFAIEMVNAGKADALMRGNTQTRDFLMPILNKANHLMQEGTILSHVTILKVPDLPKLLAVSDVTISVEPSVEQRKLIIKNLVYALQAFGIEKPNIALLALVERPSFHMRDTVEASTIVMDHQDDPIANCNLVGPIAYDLIVSKEAARVKGYDCPYCGEFDGIVVPNLLAGNLIVKILEKNAGATGAGIIMGAKIPIAITSRADGASHTYLSLATIAAMFDKYSEIK